MRKTHHVFLILALVFAFSDVTLRSQNGGSMSFSIKSAAFAEGAAVPKKYTCDGADVSPALEWSGAPAGTKSLALIADDPDAPVGTWTHWIAWNIPADHALSEGVQKQESLPDGTRQGKNDFRRIGYGGPCPPPGKPHRYVITVYALDVPELGIATHFDRKAALDAIRQHTLAKASLTVDWGR